MVGLLAQSGVTLRIQIEQNVRPAAPRSFLFGVFEARRNYMAEAFLSDVDRLTMLMGDTQRRVIVREYLCELHIDPLLADVAKFRSLWRGITEFCCLGLHRYPELGPSPTARGKLSALEAQLCQVGITIFSIDTMCQQDVLTYVENGIDPDLALTNPDGFRTLMMGLRELFIRGMHR